MGKRLCPGRADRRRALYAGGKPSPEARAIHRRFVSGPLPRLLPVAGVLEVRGRRSGKTLSVPVATVPYHGSWYLVSMLGEQSNWVRNVRFAGGNAVLIQGRRRRVQLVEIPSHITAPILRRYLLLAMGARPHFDITWRASLNQFASIADRHPVFRVDNR